MKPPAFFEADRRDVDAALQRLLPPEGTSPASIHAAMRYSVFAGGKRIRPILCVESARIFDRRAHEGQAWEGRAPFASQSGAQGKQGPAPTKENGAALTVGCALEFIHTYSLIHDDLPALDNDDLRRGLPTCHKKFGEAIAILAGDALLTLAFQTLAEAAVEPARRVEILGEVARAAGTVDGMVGGQVADLEAEGKPPEAEALEYIHRSKTAALIRASVVSGALAGGATPEDAARLREFGATVGLLFQVVDDILDVEESSAALGKTAGKDQAQKKLTYPALYGLEKSRQIADELAARALGSLEAFGGRAARLRELAEFLVARRA